jgi:hypothetical protein
MVMVGVTVAVVVMVAVGVIVGVGVALAGQMSSAAGLSVLVKNHADPAGANNGASPYAASVPAGPPPTLL